MSAHFADDTGRIWQRQCPCCDRKPVVVIDPEDREEVERLVSILHGGENWFRASGGPNQPTHASLLQNALRELINTGPDEPAGLGAVVKDSEGQLWVRWTLHGEASHAPWRHPGTGEPIHKKWAAVGAVKVLSEGVTP